MKGRDVHLVEGEAEHSVAGTRVLVPEVPNVLKQRWSLFHLDAEQLSRVILAFSYVYV